MEYYPLFLGSIKPASNDEFRQILVKYLPVLFKKCPFPARVIVREREKYAQNLVQNIPKNRVCEVFGTFCGHPQGRRAKGNRTPLLGGGQSGFSLLGDPFGGPPMGT